VSEAIRVEVDKAELLEAMRHDCVTFFAFYIGDELTLDVPALHIEVWEELLGYVEKVSQPDFLIGHLQKLFAVPREHSKSTIAKLAVILFMRYSPLSFTLYMSKTSTIAVSAIRDVVNWLTGEQERALYGDPEIIKSNESSGLWIMVIGLPNGGRKRIILRAVGQGHQVRGSLVENKRPDFFVFDDIEDLDTADDGEQQSKLDDWTLGSVMKAAARRSFRLMIGRMIKSTTLLARLSRDPTWNPTVFGAIVKDKETQQLRPLWPGRWTIEALMAEYRSYRRLGKGHLWEAEMMNLSADRILGHKLDNAVMTPDVHPEDVMSGFICVDPAFGQMSWNDETGITVHIRKKGLAIPILVDSRVGRWSETQILDQLIELSYYWNLCTWAIEAESAQKLLIPLFRLMLIERQIKPEVFSILPIRAQMQSKSSRIIAFRRAVDAKSYALAESQTDLKLKLEEYNPDSKDHDDLCDSAAYGPIVWDVHGTIIEAAGVQAVAGRLMQVAESKTADENLGELDVCQF